MESKKKAKIVLLGDLLFGDEYINYLESENFPFDHAIKNIQKKLNECHLAIINLEGPIHRGPNIRENVSVLLANHESVINFFHGFNHCVLNLANNHILDYGEEGLINTISLLADNGLDYIGAGMNSHEANRALVLEVKGKEFGFISFTSDEEFVGSIIAGENTPGCATISDEDSLIENIMELKKAVNFICVSLHWGREFFSFPSDTQVSLAHKIVDAGANLIIGHHPHFVQGFEKYRKSLIFYSLGNFFMPQLRATSGRMKHQKKETKEFFVPILEIDGNNNINFEIICGSVDENYTLNEYMGSQKYNFLKNIEQLSEPLKSDNYKGFWDNYKTKRTNELRKESFFEAFIKARSMSIMDLVKTIRFKDIHRNFKRLAGIVRDSF